MISSFVRGEKFSQVSRKFLQQVIMKNNELEFILPSIVQLETVNVLQRHGAGENDLVQISKLLIKKNFKLLPIDNYFVQMMISLGPKFSLKTNDAAIAWTAKTYSCQLISWDKQLVKTAKKYDVKAFTPEEWLRIS